MSRDFIFTNTSQPALVTVPIMEDGILELNETFRAEISLVEDDESNCVLLQPVIVEVTILDNDSKCIFFSFIDDSGLFFHADAVIGFVSEHYSVSEGIDGFANVTVKVLSGQLGREVVITVDTYTSGSATGELYTYIPAHAQCYEVSPRWIRFHWHQWSPHHL